MKFNDIPEPCPVLGCKNPVQLLAKRGDQVSWFKTCNRHSYADLDRVKTKEKSK